MVGGLTGFCCFNVYLRLVELTIKVDRRLPAVIAAGEPENTLKDE